MGEVKTYYFDTYAFIESLLGNPNYKEFGKGGCVITSIMNLMELHYYLLLKYDRDVADYYFDKYKILVVDYVDEDLKEANVLKKEYKKNGMSYVDCLGYTIARNMNVKFLTGDKEFEGLDNVEFRK